MNCFYSPDDIAIFDSIMLGLFFIFNSIVSLDITCGDIFLLTSHPCVGRSLKFYWESGPVINGVL